MRNIQISNITAYHTGNFCASITGIPEAKIENIYLSNIRFMNRGGLKEGHFLPDPEAEGKRHDLVSGSRWDRYWASYKEVKEDEKGYPQPTVWGNLPCFGLFLRHVGTVCVDGATFRPESEEPRVPLIAVDVDELRLHRLSVEGEVKRDILLHQVKQCQADETLMGVIHRLK